LNDVIADVLELSSNFVQNKVTVIESKLPRFYGSPCSCLTLLTLQIKGFDNAQVSTASVQVQPESRANVTQLRTSANQHTLYAAPQPPSTGNDVTESRQRQPEVRQVPVGAADKVPR